MKKKLNFIIAIVFMLMITFSLNINALDNNINKSKQIEVIESTSENGEYLKDAELEEWNFDENDNGEMPKAERSATASSGLTIPTEGSWDPSKTKDIKDNSGKIIEKRFYSSKNVLMEKRFYRYSGSTRIMDEKYLYWSDGQTLERKRDYGYVSSSDKYYIITTRKYRDNSTRQWTLNYAGKNSDIYENQYVYNQAGTYYLYKVLYNGKTSNIQTQRLYYQGELVNGSNRITHVGDYNAKGTKWIKVTYYKSYTNNIKTRIVKYTGDDPDNKIVYIWYYDEDSQELTNTTYYDASGQYINFKTKWKDGLKKERTYYNLDSDGKKNRTIYYDEEDGNNIQEELLYDNDGKKEYLKYYKGEASNYVIVSVKYKDNKIEYVEKYSDKESKVRDWKTEYENGEKKRTIFNNSDEYIYNEHDEIIEQEIKEVQEFFIASDIEENEFDDFVRNNGLEDELEVVITPLPDTSKKIKSENINIIEIDKTIQNTELLSTVKNSLSIEDNETLFYEDFLKIKNISLINKNDETMDFEELIMFPNLKILNITGYDLVEIPSQINYFKNLEVLKLVNTNLTKINENISDLNKLDTIDLSKNNIIYIDAIIKILPNLTTLNLSDNIIKELPRELYFFFKLGKNINVSNNNFVDTNLTNQEINENEFENFIGNQRKREYNVTYIDSEETNINIISPSFFYYNKSEDSEENIDQLVFSKYEIFYSKISVNNYSDILEDNQTDDYTELINIIKQKDNNIENKIENSEKIEINKNTYTDENLRDIMDEDTLYIFTFESDSLINNNIYTHALMYSNDMLEDDNSESSCGDNEYGELKEKETYVINGYEITNYCEFNNNYEAFEKFKEVNKDYLELLNFDVSKLSFKSFTKEYENKYIDYLNSHLNKDEIEQTFKLNIDATGVINLLDAKEKNKKIKVELLEYKNSTSDYTKNKNLEDLYFLIPDNDINKDFNDKIIQASSNEYNYKKKSAAEFAKKHANYWQKSGYSSVADCTNFVSRTLNEAGGIKKDKKESVEKGWWLLSKTTCTNSCYTTYTKSKSWYNAHWYNKYWYSKLKIKTFEQKDSWTSVRNYAKKGDIILVDWEADGTWDHAGFIYTKSDGHIGIAQHTSNYYGMAKKNKKAYGWVQAKLGKGDYTTRAKMRVYRFQ